MSASNNEVNRDIDTQTAEGHRMLRARRGPLEEETARRTKLDEVAPGDLDDVAEGHRRVF